MNGRTTRGFLALIGIGWLWLVVPAGRGTEETKPLAPRLEGLGHWHHAVTTTKPEAQDFFNQGLRLLYAFNYPEALRAFQEAARLDPACGMAYWGQAIAHGANVNEPVSVEAAAKAHEAIEKARSLRENLRESERAYIDALAVRFPADPKADRAQADAAYAVAMGELADRFPDDDDALTLAAAAVMEGSPWNYWEPDGSPRPGIDRALKRLETVLERNRDHAGAIHYYIHLVEATSRPERAERHADHLAALMPKAGHIVHMPAHIYLRVGRYADAADQNERAIEADEAYLASCRAQGTYPALYYPHNIHFLWSAATMEGRRERAIDAARKVTGKSCCGSGTTLFAEDLKVTPLYALVRFGSWDEILATPPPEESARFATAIWHYARGVAEAAKGRLDRAKTELERIEAIAAEEKLSKELLNFSKATDVLKIAAGIVAGEIAAHEGRTEDAVRQLRKAVAIQDSLVYMEPPTWHYPVRQSLGAVLLAAGRASEAEVVYREDLVRWRENGWSLFGLMQCLRSQGRDADARAVEQRFRKAWSRADIVLTASVFR